MHLSLKAIKCIEDNCTKNGIVAASSGPHSKAGGKIHKDYIHIWPRDAVLVSLELANHNKTGSQIQLHSICSGLQTCKNTGLLFQRYELDGLPDEFCWCNETGKRQLDQDALRLVAASKLPKLKKNKIYASFLSLMEKLEREETSTDVWEQKQGYFLYTTVALILGLRAGEKMFGETFESKKLIARLLKSIEYFYCNEKKSFVKGVSKENKLIDLEVVLALNLILENDLFCDSKFLIKSLNSLERVEKDLARNISGVLIPIRYNGDFWDGEKVGKAGVGRPWLMGSAMISSCYSNIAKNARGLGNFVVESFAEEKAKFWLLQFENCPNAEHFPEQICLDGSLPKNGPKNLSWCAAEYLKARRLLEELKEN